MRETFKWSDSVTCVECTFLSPELYDRASEWWHITHDEWSHLTIDCLALLGTIYLEVDSVLA